MKGKIIFVLFLLVFMIRVDAACDSHTQLQLNTSAVNVTADYEITKSVMDFEGNLHSEIDPNSITNTNNGYIPVDVVVLNVYNLSSDLYAVISNKEDSFSQKIYYSDFVGGKYTLTVPDTTKIRNYVVKIYSNNSNCLDVDLRSLNVTTPMYNPLSHMEGCQGLDNYYCERYITQPLTVDESILIKNYDADKVNRVVDDNTNKSGSFKWLLIISVIVIIILSVGAVFFFIKRKRDMDF